MFMDEARLAARIHHPNVVSTLDVLSSGAELFLVMEYVHGETLSRLLHAITTSGGAIPTAIVVGILRDTLLGLHAAHEATDEHGRPLGVVHRDVSPQNIIVGVDGVARVLDFGVAKAAGRIQTTREGQLKGKLAYMAPEQFHGETSRATDIFATSVVLWEALVGDRLFEGSEAEIVRKILSEPIPPPSSRRADLDAALDAVVLQGLARQPERRFSSAQEMATALSLVCPPADALTIGRWVRSVASESLASRDSLVREVESGVNGLLTGGPPSPSSEVIPKDDTRADLSSEVKRSHAGGSRRQAWIGTFVAVLVGMTLTWWFGHGSSRPSGIPSAQPIISAAPAGAALGPVDNSERSHSPSIDAAPPATGVAAPPSSQAPLRSAAPRRRTASPPPAPNVLPPDHI